MLYYNVKNRHAIKNKMWEEQGKQGDQLNLEAEAGKEIENKLGFFFSWGEKISPQVLTLNLDTNTGVILSTQLNQTDWDSLAAAPLNRKCTSKCWQLKGCTAASGF